MPAGTPLPNDVALTMVAANVSTLNPGITLGQSVALPAGYYEIEWQANITRNVLTVFLSNEPGLFGVWVGATQVFIPPTPLVTGVSGTATWRGEIDEGAVIRVKTVATINGSLESPTIFQLWLRARWLAKCAQNEDRGY